MEEEKVRTQEFEVNGEALLAKVKELIEEGKLRRMVIKSEEGKTIIDIPLVGGVIGVLLVPQLAAIGAIAALVTKATILIEKVDD